ncbi:hypothetical protein D9M71_568130 [compost metagenome]
MTALGVKLIRQFEIAGVMGNRFTTGLAHQIADIDPGQVVHRQHPHGQTQLGQHAVHLGGCSAFEDQPVCFARIGLQHAVANKAKADT